VMALMAHQNPLMLLFLLLQTSQLIDSSHTLDKYSVSVEVDKQGTVDFSQKGNSRHINQ